MAMPSLSAVVKKLLIIMISSYQLVISPLLGPHCRFRPTCSQYSVESIRRFGLLKGSWLTLKRILKCHALNKSAEQDPVPRQKNDNREEH